MELAIKWSALQAIDDINEKRKQLSLAVGFELAKVGIIVDALGMNLANQLDVDGSLKQGGSVFRRHELREDRIKGVLAHKYATEDNNPILTTRSGNIQEWYHTNMPELDVGYLPLFSLVDLRGSSSSSFEINDTNAGLSWSQRKPGEATKIRRAFTEAQTTVSVLEFSEGLGILDRWLQFNQFWTVADAVAEFIAKEADKRASMHYGLLTALGAGINQAFSTDDATTFNAAAASILRAAQSSGYGVGANAQLDIVCAPEHVGRILRMLDATRGSPMIAFGTQSQPIAFTVRNVIASAHIPANSTGYYLVLPGRKLKRAVWKDITLESSRDIYASATDWVGVTQYNAAVGDSGQIRRVLFS
ncbi:MAG: hypothetical protein KDI48_06960 [Xanthomonadales bacterium]|nr:hypothetical protein [Xanthomonadales bacterium]